MPLPLGRLLPLRRNDKAAYLDFLPQTLQIWEVITLMLVFIGRQIFHVLGLATQIQSKPRNAKNGCEYEMPPLSLSMLFRVRKQDLDKYAKAIDVAGAEHVLDSPVQMCLLLSALSMPAMLLLLAHHKCPIRPLGSVNVRNKFELLRPDLCSKETLLDTRRMEVRSKFLRESKKVKRGLEIDLSVELVTHDNDTPLTVFRQTFTMLQFMKFRGTPLTPHVGQAKALDQVDWSGAETASVRLSVKHPKLWASICKDYNPIHMSTLAAKAFGFPSKIAHGNLALAFGMARLESADGIASKGMREPVCLEVQFKRPVSLPAVLVAESVQHGERTDFRLRKHDKVCVTAVLNLSAAH